MVTGGSGESAAACLPFFSHLPQMVKDVDHVPDSTRGFFDLGGQVDAGHGNDLGRENRARRRHAVSISLSHTHVI